MQGQQKFADNFKNNFSKTYNENLGKVIKSNNEKYYKSGMRPDDNNLKIMSQQEFDKCSFGDS